MARIPDAELERLKAEISVERLVEASGVQLTKTGFNALQNQPTSALQKQSFLGAGSESRLSRFSGCMRRSRVVPGAEAVGRRGGNCPGSPRREWVSPGGPAGRRP
ncbi:hypothetical protein [Holophaga foetida]|uniref:hypothetical protein n=1 Tax=Holophaga foetida TaxID=35839 RepID=UPI0002474636|nr:hypothetical protein [Holophaga foetida]